MKGCLHFFIRSQKKVYYVLLTYPVNFTRVVVQMFGKTISFLLMPSVKLLCGIFYRYEVSWLYGNIEQWPDIRLVVFLNHTSLFEPIFIRLAPFGFIWRISNRLLAPGADITLARPITGRVFKLLLPGVIPISRKRDYLWQHFLQKSTPTL